MTIARLAEAHRVRTRIDSCGEKIITGRPHKAPRPECRNQVFDYGDGEHFGVSLLLSNARLWRNARKRLTAAGMSIHQDGDTEGTLLFDPCNPKQARAAIKEAGIKRKKVLSEPVRIARAMRLKRARDCKERAISGVKTLESAEVNSTSGESGI